MNCFYSIFLLSDNGFEGLFKSYTGYNCNNGLYKEKGFANTSPEFLPSQSREDKVSIGVGEIKCNTQFLLYRVFLIFVSFEPNHTNSVMLATNESVNSKT